ncbi:MAG: hypothetical protein ACPG80_03570, partial [Rickettsiales bacterium]
MVVIYTLTSVLSAFLVFFIQPVIAKVALPTLGGIPAVWNGCMLFFQAMLLLGYLYAHLLNHRFSIRQQPLIHLLLLGGVLLLFPLSFGGNEQVNPAYHPLSWLFFMLLYSVGLPFFAISASAPLLQKWFSHTSHPAAGNPYFLYAASNFGSMTALLSYPFVVEPFLTLRVQISSWELGVMALVGLFSASAVYLLYHARERGGAVSIDSHTLQHAMPVDTAQRLRWLLLSFVPASLLYGVTTYITTDIASVPLLWLLPLTLYLITFILVFSGRFHGGQRIRSLH